ncbi:hypothetical protein [Paraburkholderia aromaticivorans]|uniref:hypothetical protein n=1 Tax=Paraburkholderia aromaticivorans TaxID=2026199 RepID=UPI001455F738|nr:hypothetical protein [Paraburkholderia aromaticivorans]
MRIEDIKSLHLDYARAQMNCGATPLPPINPKRASVVRELPAVEPAPVEPSPRSPSVAQAVSLRAADVVDIASPVPSARETVLIETALPVLDTPLDGFPSTAADPSVALSAQEGTAPRLKEAIKARYLVIAAAMGVSVIVLAYRTPPQAHVSGPVRKVDASPPARPKPLMTIPVVPTAASATSTQTGLTSPYDNVAPPGSGTQMNAAPAHPVASAAQQQAGVPTAANGRVPHRLTAQDLMPDSATPDFGHRPSGLAHVDPHEFTGHQSRAEPETRVVEVQAGGGDDARPGSVYEAPIRKVIRSLPRANQPARVATGKQPVTTAAAAAPTVASAAAARHPGATSGDAGGDQQLF